MNSFVTFSRALALTPKECAFVLANRLLAQDIGSAALFVSGIPPGDISHALLAELERRGRYVVYLDLGAINDPPNSGALLDHWHSRMREVARSSSEMDRSRLWSKLRRRTRKRLALVVESTERLVGDPHCATFLGTLKSASESLTEQVARGLVIAFLGHDHERMCCLVNDKRQPFFASTLVKVPPVTFWP